MAYISGTSILSSIINITKNVYAVVYFPSEHNKNSQNGWYKDGSVDGAPPRPLILSTASDPPTAESEPDNNDGGDHIGPSNPSKNTKCVASRTTSAHPQPQTATEEPEGFEPATSHFPR